ncbi:Mor transcription activator family protein [Paraburkholderia fungorum]|uniref:Mor transcription activator family protein n=1 Tax=Paraburkholderia fungorum TaxID=134537 RepID=UPI00402B14CE
MIESSQISWPDNYPAQLVDIGNIIAAGLAQAGITGERVGPTAFGIVESIRSQCGGSAFYLSRGRSYVLTQREEQIWREFDGKNYYQLAKKHGLSETRIRTIVKRGKARDRARRQSTLFDAD